MVATGAGTPWATRFVRIDVGSDEDRPTIISEKNKPIDSTIPEFWKVALMPDAAPRCRAGTAFMIAVVLGAANRPKPMPFRKISRAKTGNEKLAGNDIRSRKVAAPSTMPPVENALAPYLSDSQPDVGPASRKPMVSGIM